MLNTVGDIIDAAQSYLHDPQGKVWTREELLRQAREGYMNLVGDSLPLVRLFQLDVPPRYSASGTQEWEDRHVHGRFNKFSWGIQTLTWQGTYQWESEQFAGNITPTDSGLRCTQDWERVYAGAPDSHFTFVLAQTHEQPRYSFWGDKRLYPRSVSELDLRDQRWWLEAGEPIFYLNGVGRELSFEIFEVDSNYAQAYELQFYEQGTPRQFTSDARTYGVQSPRDTWDYGYSGGDDFLSIAGLGFRFTKSDVAGVFYTQAWEGNFATDSSSSGVTIGTSPEENWLYGTAQSLGVGLVRSIDSPDRDYSPQAYDTGMTHVGIPRDWHSSDSSITIFEHTAVVRDILETDRPDLIPQQCFKFIKYYILNQAFSRQGEGYRPDLAQHFAALYQIGVDLLAVLATPSSVDNDLARGQVNEVRTSTPPKVRMPSHYPALRR